MSHGSKSPRGKLQSGLVRILNRDLAAADIPEVDKYGRSIDVHVLQHTFATLLSNSGVAPRIAQAVMRHSNLRLTMNTYTDQKQLDIYGAFNNLPLLNSPIESETNQSTDSEDKHTNDSNVVSLISDNPPALRTFQDVNTEAEHSSRLVSPMVSPKACPKGTIQDDCS
ncbi:MAG: tyrosine-type recombinase/integrase, partial [Mariniblastus sp.]